MNTDNFKNHYEKHIVEKIKQEIFGRYEQTQEWSKIEKMIKESLKKVTIPYMDFSITTKCTLQCKYCTQWQPYIKNKRNFTLDEIDMWLKKMYDNIDECIFVTILGGEPFLHPQLGELLRLFVEYRKRGKIKLLRLVTNGTITPPDDIIKFCADNKIYILVSDYGNVLNNNMKIQRKELFAKMDKWSCDYFYGENATWIDLGLPSLDSTCILSNEQEKKRRFKGCFIKDCAAFFEGVLYRCPRGYVLEHNKWYEIHPPEKIDFKETNKENLIENIREFYSLADLNACAFCNDVRDRKSIEAAIQIEGEK